MTDLATKPATESWGRWLGCSSSTRPHLTNSALGGDEFLCLFSRYDRQTVIAAAERILQRIGGYEFRMVPGEADRHAITASGGLAFLRPKSTAEDSMRQADIAMYEAKGKGRNRLVLYDQLQESMDDGDQGRRKCLPPGRRSQITHALFEVGGQYRRSM